MMATELAITRNQRRGLLKQMARTENEAIREFDWSLP
jgi:hypothetical protein